MMKSNNAIDNNNYMFPNILFPEAIGQRKCVGIYR
jgi:hypothetical protein